MRKSCTIEGCAKPLIARGMCGMHYRRWRVNGDPSVTRPRPPTPPAEPRFWAKVEKGEGCWLWQAKSDRDGYGRFWVDGQTRRAHVVSWQWANGQRVPKGLCVLHHCDNPPCVNPAHLFVGTVADNNADRAAKGRSAKVKPKARGRTLGRTCTLDGCAKRHVARGLCQRHYAAWKRENSPACSMPDCEAPLIARGLCHRHYKRWQVFGDPYIASRREIGRG